MGVVRRVRSEELRHEEIAALRELLDAAWSSEADDFTDEDWDHAVGGVHFLVEEERAIVAHASVVERELHTGDHRLATGYVEAVATRPAQRRRGHGSSVMREVGAYIDGTFRLGALGGDPGYYERLGWVAWSGPTFVRTDAGLVRTPDEDGFVLVRLTPTTPQLDLSAPISCEWRSGDVW